MGDVTILDGGMGQELVARSGRPPQPLWSTQVMLDMPGLVGEVHRAYRAAGANVATTNTYAIHRDRLRGGSSNHYAEDGLEMPDQEHRFTEFLDLALDEAEAVRGTSTIAGAIGPLGASYRSDLNPPFAEAVELYAEVARHLAPRVDVILYETIASVEAALACLAAGLPTDRPVWLALTVDDEDGTLLRSGEPIADAVAQATGAAALLVNCSAPEVIPEALPALAEGGVPYGAYAYVFTQITKVFLACGTTVAVLS